MVDGLYKVRIMADTITNSAATGRYIDCWQNVVNGEVTGYVDAALKNVKLPDVHEAVVLDPDLLIAPNGKRFKDATTDELIATGWLPPPAPEDVLP